MEALGRGDIAVAAVMRALYPGVTMTDIDPPTRPLARLTERLRKGPRGVRIQGMDNLMVRFSVCCQPVPGDEVLGYITRGRGVSIHRSDCPNILTLSAAPERRVEIEWTAEKGDRFFVKVYLTGTDRHGLLTDVSKAITDTSTNIQHADMRSTDMGMVGAFVVEVQHLSHLEKVLKAVKRVKGVISVERRESFGEADLPDS